MTPTTPSVYIGIDVAKATLQMHLQGRQSELENTPAAHRKLGAQLHALPGAHVVCEATGGYEQRLVQALQAAQVRVSVVNPGQVRGAAQAKGQRAKSDPIDAAQLTDYGQRYQPQSTPPVSAVQRELIQLTNWLKQLIDTRARAKVQSEHLDNSYVLKKHSLMIDYYDIQINDVETRIGQLMAQDPQLKARLECLDAIAGVGFRTAVVVLAHMPELGTLSRQAAGALAGLAPYDRDSGTIRGARCIAGGRAEIRQALYMACLSSIRHNPVLTAVFKQLTARGKPGKVALTAVMRKLVVYMNSLLKALPPVPTGTATKS
jgi:transposase